MKRKKKPAVRAAGQPTLPRWGRTRRKIAEEQAGVKLYEVDLYGEGVRLQTPTHAAKGNPKPAKRGKIEGWSKSSRRRMREWLLTKTVPDTQIVGASMTIPGPSLPATESKELWHDWCRDIERRGWSVVWRMEVQSRGQLHWHCLVYLPPKVGRGQIADSWWDALRGLGRRVFDPPHRLPSGDEILSVSTLMAMPGADRRSCVTNNNEDGCANWKRYIQDHATKAKQEQIPENMGRHWGVVGRNRFKACEIMRAYEMTAPEYWRFLRAYQRLCTPSFKCDGVPFGRRLGFRIRRGKWGGSVWFSNPSTVERLVKWAKQETRCRDERERKPRGGLRLVSSLSPCEPS